MKKVSLYEEFINEKREDVGKYNTVKKVIAKIGRRPSEQELATFINNNYYDVTEVERGDDDPQANDKIADLVGFYKFDIEDWEIAWADAQNESVVTEAFIGPFVFNDTMSDEELKAMYDGALDGYAYWQKGYQYPKSDYKKAYQEIEKLLKKRGVKVDESVVTEAKNTIGLAFKDEDDYNGFVEFIDDEGGKIFKNIGWDNKTKSWEVIMDVKVLDDIYGEGTPANKESGWYGALPGDFESVIIESVVTESKKSEALADAITKSIMKIDDTMSYADFALAVGQILRDDYGQHNFMPFMKVLHNDLGIK